MVFYLLSFLDFSELWNKWSTKMKPWENQKEKETEMLIVKKIALGVFSRWKIPFMYRLQLAYEILLLSTAFHKCKLLWISCSDIIFIILSCSGIRECRACCCLKIGRRSQFLPNYKPWYCKAIWNRNRSQASCLSFAEKGGRETRPFW